MARGGSRNNHAAQLAAHLDYLAIESRLAQQELSDGWILAHPTLVAERYREFSAEVERLARTGIRHLHSVKGGAA